MLLVGDVLIVRHLVVPVLQAVHVLLVPTTALHHVKRHVRTHAKMHALHHVKALRQGSLQLEQ